MTLDRAFYREDLERLRELARALDTDHPVPANALQTLEALLARAGDLIEARGVEVVDIVVLEVRSGFRCRRGAKQPPVA